MADRYQQFLGSNPGAIVELIDDSGSPYKVSTENGFEFYISADDFNNYYRRVGESTPLKWRPMVTQSDEAFVNSVEMAQVIQIVKQFEEPLQHFDKARTFVRDLLKALETSPKPGFDKIKAQLADLGWNPTFLTENQVKEIAELNDKVRSLLLSDSCGVMPLIEPIAGLNGDRAASQGSSDQDSDSENAGKKKKKRTPAKTKQPRMKNVELALEGDNLTVKVDLTQDFGPSKSGKTTIVASSVGNKTIPGREERIGLNVYRQEAKKPAKGRKQEFKNMVMSVDGDVLTITVDLSVDLGPSKSGQTILVASTGGNQLVVGREEKIGFNIYRPVG
jgi:hypothetical protein